MSKSTEVAVKKVTGYVSKSGAKVNVTKCISNYITDDKRDLVALAQNLIVGENLEFNDTNVKRVIVTIRKTLTDLAKAKLIGSCRIKNKVHYYSAYKKGIEEVILGNAVLLPRDEHKRVEVSKEGDDFHSSSFKERRHDSKEEALDYGAKKSSMIAQFDCLTLEQKNFIMFDLAQHQRIEFDEFRANHFDLLDELQMYKSGLQDVHDNHAREIAKLKEDFEMKILEKDESIVIVKKLMAQLVKNMEVVGSIQGKSMLNFFKKIVGDHNV